MEKEKPGLFKRLFIKQKRAEDKAHLKTEETTEKSLIQESNDKTNQASKNETETKREQFIVKTSTDTKEQQDNKNIKENNVETNKEHKEEFNDVSTPFKKISWFERLKIGLKRTSSSLSNNLLSIINKRRLDDDTLQELEDLLIQSDLGLETAINITNELSKNRYGKEITSDEIKTILSSKIEQVLKKSAQPLLLKPEQKLHILLMVGVNGTGKTTTIGKLASKFSQQGKKVMLAAGDTFRAAAIEQLKVWGERTNAQVISKPQGSDSASLAFEAIDEALKKQIDILMIDTAGRLQNKNELMAELEKIIRVIKKKIPDAPHHTLLTLDATTGQNALKQVEIFSQKAQLTGLVMTKLDGTARGGILVAVASKFNLPIHYIGIGEGIDDLEAFKAADFAKALTQ